jgi:proteic killer suppression protein
MDLEYEDESLERLETDPGYDAGHSRPVVKAFRKVIQVIRAAPDERAFYAMKSLHFEKLKGKLEGIQSMRLNDQWRLLMRFERRASGKIVVIISIADYH